MPEMIDKPKREKHWSEIDIEKKVERTRKVVKRLQGELSRLGLRMRKGEKHTHDPEGEAIAAEKLGRYGGTESPMPRREESDDVYF